MRILVLCALVAAASASSWTYDREDHHGPNHWPDECVKSSSESQSPIDINPDDASKETYSPGLRFKGYSSVDVTVENNGHSVQATVDSDEYARVYYGGLPGTYKLAQFHLHWGSEDDKGSEHTIDDDHYPMEVHFVHYNKKYGSLSRAASKKDGLAVMAWFFKVDDDNSYWQRIFQELPLHEGSSFRIENLNLYYLMGSRTRYYRYNGSLTTPPCYESVIWTIFKKPIEISEDQLDRVRDCEDHHERKMSNNYRPTQNLNGRRIYYVKY